MHRLRFTGGYKYRFKYADGSHKDYVFAGDNGKTTIWRADDGTEKDGSIFNGVVEVESVETDRAINEMR